jgi:hypothetical protein
VRTAALCTALVAALTAGCQDDGNTAPARPSDASLPAPATTPVDSTETPPPTDTGTTPSASSTPSSLSATSQPVSSAGPCNDASEPPATYEHVVMIVEENRTWTGGRSAAVGMGFSGGDMPFLEDLAARCSYFTDWAEMDETENSLNQYIGLTSGVKSTTVSNDCDPSETCRSTDDNIFRQVRASGGTARTYVDGATEPCSVGGNRAKHIPALYYQGGDDPDHCVDEVRPMSEFDADRLPTFAFIVPDQCHDGHDCDDGVVDAWARSTIEPVLVSPAYQHGDVLVVVIYDEDRPVPNLFVAPTANAGPIDSVVGTHAGLMKAVESALGLAVLDQGQLPAAPDLRTPANV